MILVIRRERKSDGTGWLKWNLDGSKHVDIVKKSKQQQQQQPQALTMDDGTQQQVAELTKHVSNLKEIVNVLISQIQMLRSEVKKRECSKVQVE